MVSLIDNIVGVVDDVSTKALRAASVSDDVSIVTSIGDFSVSIAKRETANIEDIFDRISDITRPFKGIASVSPGSFLEPSKRFTSTSALNASVVAGNLKFANKSSFTATPLTNSSDLTVNANKTSAKFTPLTNTPSNSATINDVSIGKIKEIDTTWQVMTLTVRTKNDTQKSQVRKLDSNSGKYEVKYFSDGTYEAIDTTAEKNTYTLDFPNVYKPPRQRQTISVKSYSETPVGSEGTDIQATIQLILNNSRSTESKSLSNESRSSGEWLFDMNNGKFATKRVTVEPERRGVKGVKKRDVTVLVDSKQTQTFECNASALEAVNIRNVPDGDNVVEDNNSVNRNTIDITKPTGGDDFLDTGTYVVQEWRSGFLNYNFYKIDMTILEK